MRIVISVLFVLSSFSIAEAKRFKWTLYSEVKLGGEKDGLNLSPDKEHSFDFDGIKCSVGKVTPFMGRPLKESQLRTLTCVKNDVEVRSTASCGDLAGESESVSFTIKNLKNSFELSPLLICERE